MVEQSDDCLVRHDVVAVQTGEVGVEVAEVSNEDGVSQRRKGLVLVSVAMRASRRCGDVTSANRSEPALQETEWDQQTPPFPENRPETPRTPR